MAGFLSNKGTNLICKERKVNSKTDSGFCPQMLLVFQSVVCISGKIGQSLLNEVPVERSILADSAYYHGKPDGSRKNNISFNMYGSICNQNDQSGRQRVKINELTNFSCALINLIKLR